VRRRSSTLRDLNQLAAYIVEQAMSDMLIEEAQQEQRQETEKNSAVVALGRLGGLQRQG
jgi:glutamine synthetase adenylyltransferase